MSCFQNKNIVRQGYIPFQRCKGNTNFYTFKKIGAPNKKISIKKSPLLIFYLQGLPKAFD